MSKILIIENDVATKNHLVNILQLAAYDVVIAEDGQQGIQIALTQKVDLIICDNVLPIINGYGVLHVLRRNNILRDTSFVFVDTKLHWPEIRKGIELGASDYIINNISATEMLDIVDKCLYKIEQTRLQLPENANGLPAPIDFVSTLNDYMVDIKNDRNTNCFKRKQSIYSTNNHPFAVYYIIKGKVKTYKRNSEGKELITGLYRDNEFFGYMAVLERKTYCESAEALEDTEIAVIPRAEFEAMVNNRPMIMKKLIDMLAQNLEEKEAKLLNIAYDSLRQKVAHTLISIYKKYNVNSEELFCIDITRENLAAIAGVAKESLTRTLSDFRQESMIDLIHSRIKIINYPKLERLRNA